MKNDKHKHAIASITFNEDPFKAYGYIREKHKGESYRNNEDNFGAKVLSLPGKKPDQLKKYINNLLVQSCLTLGERFEHTDVGACMLASIIYAKNNKVIVQSANIGDCQLFLVTKKIKDNNITVKKLSTDFNVANKDNPDIAKVIQAGGMILGAYHSPNPFGAALQITRALGDRHIFAPYRSKENIEAGIVYESYQPDISLNEVDLTDLELAWLIHCSDGLEYAHADTNLALENKIAAKVTKALADKLSLLEIAEFLSQDKDIKFDDYNALITELHQFIKVSNKALAVITCDGHGGDAENQISEQLPELFFKTLQSKQS